MSRIMRIASIDIRKYEVKLQSTRTKYKSTDLFSRMCNLVLSILIPMCDN